MYKYSNLEKILNKQFLGNTEIRNFFLIEIFIIKNK